MGGDDDYVEINQYERKMIDIADKRLKEYEQLYIPMEAQQMRDVERYNSEMFRQGMQDQSVNAARMNSPGTVMAGAGANPGMGGGFKQQAIASEQTVGTASGMGAMAGLQSAEDLYSQGSLNLAATGRGQTGAGMGMTSALASQQAGFQAAQKAAQQSVRDAQWGAAGSVAGAAAAYGNSQGWFDGADPGVSNPDSLISIPG